MDGLGIQEAGNLLEVYLIELIIYVPGFIFPLQTIPLMICLPETLSKWGNL